MANIDGVILICMKIAAKIQDGRRHNDPIMPIFELVQDLGVIDDSNKFEEDT